MPAACSGIQRLQGAEMQAQITEAMSEGREQYRDITTRGDLELVHAADLAVLTLLTPICFDLLDRP